LKIVIVSSSDLYGGAARAAYRLHRSLINNDIDSTMVVQNKVSNDYTVIGPSSKLGTLINRLRPALDHIVMKLIGSKVLFSSSYLPFSSVVDKVNSINPSIVHLHWVAGGTLRVEDLEKINAPIVWNCQDMWPFTGGCHYDDNCEEYKKKCGNCKISHSNTADFLSGRVFARKQKVYSKIHQLTVVGVSKWITNCVKQSSLFKNKKVLNIPNCFNTSLFKPIDKNLVKDLFNIPKDKQVILFGAMNSLSDSRKGAKELFEAIALLDIENTIFVVAGSGKPKESLGLKYPVYFIDSLKDEVSLPLLYNIANVMVVPSLQENLANSLIESLSCGIPVVAFDIGGNSDIVEHKKNGYLAKAIDSKDMAFGIEWILNNKKYDDLSNSARQKVLNDFDSKVVVKQYVDLYKTILKDNNDTF